jgi:hypothetical protein
MALGKWNPSYSTCLIADGQIATLLPVGLACLAVLGHLGIHYNGKYSVAPAEGVLNRSDRLWTSCTTYRLHHAGARESEQRFETFKAGSWKTNGTASHSHGGVNGNGGSLRSLACCEYFLSLEYNIVS